jgi:hypothetical protein
MTISRAFNKINGQEIGKMLLADIQQAIGRDDGFRLSITYLEFEYTVDIRCRYVPSVGDPMREFSQQIAGGRTLVEFDDAGKVRSLVPENAPRGIFEVTRTRKHSGQDEPPDKLRREQGLYIPSAQVEPVTGQIVDTPVTQVVEEQLETERTTADMRRVAVRERDEEMKARGVAPLHLSARPAQELSRDVDSDQVVEVRLDIQRAERIKTELPAEHVVTE